ncbi:MAG: hypothetical protein V8S33_10135 [Intestinibacter bartlettii]
MKLRYGVCNQVIQLIKNSKAKSEQETIKDEDGWKRILKIQLQRLILIKSQNAQMIFYRPIRSSGYAIISAN